MMDPERHITLRELQRLVRQTLDERFALPLWVSAEISEIKVNYSGHCYLELVEKGGDNGVPTAQARAVIWRSNYPRIAGYFDSDTTLTSSEVRGAVFRRARGNKAYGEPSVDRYLARVVEVLLSVE